jgi:hypothetical protein
MAVRITRARKKRMKLTAKRSQITTCVTLMTRTMDMTATRNA